MKGKGRVVALLVWLAGLLLVGWAAQAVAVAHRDQARGRPEGFPSPVAGADVPPLGVNVALEQYGTDEALDEALTGVADGGFAWVRQSFYWSQIEPQPGQFDWTAADRMLSALDRHSQLRLVAMLDDSPATPPPDPDRFAAFAAAFAARYGDRVDYYQVWDEPNLADRWGGGPVNPAAYADLLARTAAAVRRADPDAWILLAGLAPTVETGPQNLSEPRYLARLYEAGAAPYFDVVVGKPYGFDTGPDDRRVDEAVLNFSRLLLLREVMVKHGDGGKAVWASHWGWNALPPGWDDVPSLWGQTDAATQAARTVAALERARTEWDWVGALILEHWQPAAPPDDPRWGFALVGRDGALRPVYHAVARWTSALPDAAPLGGYPAHNRWTTYQGAWRIGPLGADVGADGDRVRFRLAGPAVALTVRRGPYRGFVYVTVDGAPANRLPRDALGRAYIVLYDDEPSIATVPLASGLSPTGPHTVTVVAEGGQGAWSLVDWRVGPEPRRDEAGLGWALVGLTAVGLALLGLAVRDARRLAWADWGQRFLAWPEGAQVALMGGGVGLRWGAAALRWGRVWDRPGAVVGWLVSLPLAGGLIWLFRYRLDLGLAIVAAAAPFYLHPGPAFYGALSLPAALILLCGVAGLVRWGPRRWVLKLTLLDGAVLAWGLAAALSGLLADDKPTALFELGTVFLLPMLYYGGLRRARGEWDERAWWRILDGWVLGAVVVAVIGLVQYGLGRNLVPAEGGLPRLRSVYPSPNGAGLYLGRVWPLLLAVAWWGRVGQGGRRRWWYGAALIPVSLAVALSFSRGALLLGLPAGLVAMGWLAGGRSRRVVLALIGLGALALIPLMRLPRFASLLDLERGSTFFRLEVWRSSLAMIREHPWFGVGPGNFLAAYRSRYVLPSAWQEFNLEHPHNIYLDHWTRLGLGGVLAGLAVLGAFWRALRSRLKEGLADRSLLLGLVGSTVVLLVHGMVDNTLFFPDLMMVFMLTLAVGSRED